MAERPSFIWKRPLWQSLGATLLAGTLGLSGCTASPQANSRSSTATANPAANRDLGQLRLLYSRAPVTLNPHLATGVQDFEAGRIVFEPLASADADGTLQPILAATIPTVDNGGLAEDGKSVTWSLKPDLVWADGTPLTAADVAFTFEWLQNPQVAAATAQYYEAVESVEALDDTTVKITFKTVNSAWAIPFTGQTGVILPQHIFGPGEPTAPDASMTSAEAGDSREASESDESSASGDSHGAVAQESGVRQAEANLRPVGTGPYQVLSFQPGEIIFEPNPNYRGEAPAFETVTLVGGMAPYTAAREVLSVGSADFAYNLQVEVSALEELQTQGVGTVVPVFGGLVERLMLNPTDPRVETATGERSSLTTAHPFLSDLRVRQAIAHAIDHQALAKDLYGFMGRPTYQVLVMPTLANGVANPYPYDVTLANRLLDEAGWVDSNDNGTRDRDGIEMEVVFQTSVNPVRQRTQEQIQASLRDIGIAVDIKRVQVDDFFSADPLQTNSINHFYADMQAYTTGSDHPDPTIYLEWWTCGQIATQANNWQKPNNARYCNPAYDTLWQAAQAELDQEKRASLFEEMNALLVQDVAMIPIVHRAIANGVNQTLTGLEPTPWDASTWDIAQWQRQVPSGQQ
ncbi:MAG: peptide ABC transporter substrate-binding protein [Cyanobacteria bacterium]|nr:peptide ABC transporter substrate-binding protein [Cyanobacteriota bacterium]MDA0864942.1 peptide ABC transporter substrate-binding protein [Cyanobacteriota bacterium]